LRMISDADAPRPSLFRACPPDLEGILMKGLRRTPAERYQNAEELQRDLDEVARAHGLNASPLALERYMRRQFAGRIAAWEAAQQAPDADEESLIGTLTLNVSDLYVVDDALGDDAEVPGTEDLAPPGGATPAGPAATPSSGAPAAAAPHSLPAAAAPRRPASRWRVMLLSGLGLAALAALAAAALTWTGREAAAPAREAAPRAPAADAALPAARAAAADAAVPAAPTARGSTTETVTPPRRAPPAASDRPLRPQRARAESRPPPTRKVTGQPQRRPPSRRVDPDWLLPP